MSIEGREAIGDLRHPHLSPGYTYGDEPEATQSEKPEDDKPKPRRKPAAKE